MTKATKALFGASSVVCFILIILHGIDALHFKVDDVSIALFILVILPLTPIVLKSLKFGDKEISLRNLSPQDQIFVFLETIASQQQWTFYIPRNTESGLGQAFPLLLKNIVKNDPKELKKWVKKLVASEDNNLIWFASEVIGYFRLEQSKDILPIIYSTLGQGAQWPQHALNCLWAYSRFHDYRELDELLLNTTNEDNQRWILTAYKQMLAAGDCARSRVEAVLREFCNRKDIVSQVVGYAGEILEAAFPEKETQIGDQKLI